MSVTLRATKWTPEVSAHGFTSLNIKHKVSCMKHGNDIFEVSFTDDHGQDYKMMFYAATQHADILIDDATADRINHPDEFLAMRKHYAAESAVSEINERVVIDF